MWIEGAASSWKSAAIRLNKDPNQRGNNQVLKKTNKNKKIKIQSPLWAHCDVRKRHPSENVVSAQTTGKSGSLQISCFLEICWVDLFFLPLPTSQAPLNKSSWFRLKTPQRTLVKHVFILRCIECQVWLNVLGGPGNHRTSTTKWMMVKNKKAISTFWTKCTSPHINYFISLSCQKGRRHSLL